MKQEYLAIDGSIGEGGGQTHHAALHSQELFFEPGQPRGGRYRFDIGTAGAATLVLQTIYLPLAPSQYHTARITHHLMTNAEVIQTFLPTSVQIIGSEGQPGVVEILSKNSG